MRFLSLLASENVLADILKIFSTVITWLVSAVNSIVPMFWAAETGLTFMGVLAVSALAISVTLLVVRVIQNFLHFRS